VKLQIPRLPPDFLSGLVVSVDFMRLSSKKAAYVVVGENSVKGNPEFARDDKLEAGGPPWHRRSGMDRTSTTETNPVSFARVLFNAFSKLRRPKGRSSVNLDSSNRE
jgi:hypothetical protein